MHRSGSTSRFSDDNFSYYASSSPSAKVPTALRALSDVGPNELPRYEPLSEAARKDKSRARFAAKAVHAIPFVLLLCALILWIFSDRADMNVRGSSAAEMANKGYLASDGTGHLPLHLGDLSDPVEDTNAILSQTRS